MIDVFTDIHRYAPHSIFENEIKAKYLEMMFLSTTFLIGDYIDMKNVKKSKISEAQTLMDATIQMLGARYVKGNHELDAAAPPFTIMNLEDGRKCMLTHGDYPVWGINKAKKWRSRAHGSNFIQRFFTLIWSKIRESFLNPSELDSVDRILIEIFALENLCDVIVIGHLHPKKLIKYEIGNVEIYVCPRGHTSLPLNLKL